MPPDTRQPYYVFTKMRRHPDWMGFCATLPNLAGLQAAVKESEELPGEPGIVLALTPEMMGSPSRSRFPNGPASHLRMALTWHKAACHWLPKS